jgi:glutaminyl-tRNA synthetase
LYDRLFRVPNPGAADSLEGDINPESLITIGDAKLEPGLIDSAVGRKWQFERLGYFSADPKLSAPGRPVFNRVVTLRDTWAKIEQKP